jgi:diaminopimelate epimerase
MKLRFTKMQGLGNDFVVLDGVRQSIALTPQDVRALADRHFGIGCDQVLVVERAQGDADFRYRIFNSSGEEVEHCGNGARCFVVFARDQGLTDRRELRVETKNGRIVLRLEADGEVTVDMGAPRFAAEDVPFTGGTGAAVETLDVAGAPLEISALSMGNPHAVQVVRDVEAAPVTTQGPAIEHHPRFPQRVNAGYMQVVDRATIRLRVWERGAGETLACGTGACAAVVAGVRRGLLDGDVTVHAHGGSLRVRWAGAGTPVLMTGPAVTVFEGTYDTGHRD